MKITLICDVYDSTSNGSTITCYRLKEGLKKRGHKVQIVCASDKKDPDIFPVPKRSFGIFNSYVAKNDVVLAKKDYAAVSKAVKDSDLVHIMIPFVCGKLAIKAAKEFHVPTTAAFHVQPENVSVHFGMRKFPPANSMLYFYFKHKIFKHVDYIHCPSNFIANILDKHGYSAKKYVISNGVTDIFKRKHQNKPANLKDKFCIFTSGRFSSEKRQELLIKAADLSSHKEDICLIFAGKGPQENSLKKLAAKKSVAAEFMFFDNPDDLCKAMNYCDLYVHASDVEIESMACLEAITAGMVPVISDSKQSAAGHFALHKENLFASGNAKDLADKIDYFIENPEIKKQMSDEYVKYTKQFRIDDCIDAMVGMFNDAIKTKAIPK